MLQIVIVDDRLTNRNVLSQLARQTEEDVNVSAFGDPNEALAWLEGNSPDLIITDYRMPAMDGAEFTRRARQLQSCFDVPIIVVTVYEDREFRYEALEAGATDFLLSPFDHHEFRVRARNLLTLRRQHQIIKNRCFSLEHKLRVTHSRYEADQRASRQKLIDIVDAVPAMISATDSQGRYVLINAQLCKFFGFDYSAAYQKRPVEIMGTVQGGRHEALDREVLETGREIATIEEHAVDAEGNPRDLLTRKVPLQDRSQNDMIVVTVTTDITPLKAAEDELLTALEGAELANVAKTEFLANMSHELRTPLNAIFGFSQMMAQQMLGPMEDQYVEYCENIQSSASHLLSLINDLLDVSRIEAGFLEMREESIDLSQVAEDVSRILSERASEQGVALTVDVPTDLPHLHGDRRRIKQVFINLLSNAIKFTPSGGYARLSAERDNSGGLKITMEDSGVGIAAQHIPKALERFGRIESPDHIRHPGTGLGLPLSVDLVKLHDGTFSLESDENAGTRITIEFPQSRTV